MPFSYQLFEGFFSIRASATDEGNETGRTDATFAVLHQYTDNGELERGELS